MANINCDACSEIRNDAPGIIVNGITDTECASLQNNTGLNPSSGNDDCTDLNNLNDCLIGNMESEVESFDVCEWKPFMKKFIPNVWTVLKGVICAVCGLWTNIAGVLEEIRKIWERLNVICSMISATLVPPLSHYGVMPLTDMPSHNIGTVNRKSGVPLITFLPDDGRLNPNLKGAQGFGIDYGRIQTVDCATGGCQMVEWTQVHAFYCSLNSNVAIGDVLWYATKAEVQNACGMSDAAWNVYAQSSWTFSDNRIISGAASGKIANLRLLVNPGGMGNNYIGVEFAGTSYPSAAPGYEALLNPANQPRAYVHSC